ncbi:MAG: hypothetical protein ACJARZ_002297 [Dokdonia sp.]|jgi:hypothetical protein
MDHLNIDSYIAVGYLRGSTILATLLTQDPRIPKAVLDGMAIDFTNPQWDWRLAFADVFSGRAPLNALTEGAVYYATYIKASYHSWLFSILSTPYL